VGKVRVAVNGYGTIGKRVADAVARQPDLELVGVAKTRPNYEAQRAVDRRIPVYLAGDGSVSEFGAAGIKVAGALSDLLGQVDVVVDATPEKVGRENRTLYDRAGVRSIFQGGEKGEIADASFSALANYDQCRGKRHLRIVSCNTTGIARAAAVLLPRWGIERWEVVLVRRATDPADTKKGPVNGIVPTLKIPSHHGPDVRTIFPELPITTTALVVPTTLMHVHVNHLAFRNPPKDASEVLAAFRSSPRFRLFASWEHVDGTAQAMEVARDRAGMGGDMMENALWEDGLRLDGRELRFFQAIHQESIVVPENIDAIRAMMDLAPDAAASIRITDRALGLVRG
jgi:glyceraldehyde-3-phosphate dehydrogenase (NAD(P))